ncbi:glycosyltransferase [Bacteroidota bacterium]
MTQFQNIDKLPPHVNKYLSKYVDNKWKLELSSNKKYKMAIVIPAIMEYENIRKLLQSLSQNDPAYFDECIIIFVINNLICSDSKVKDDNRKSLDLIRQLISGRKNPDELITGIINSGMNFGLIDAATDDLQFTEKTGGVGLARKTGMDLALNVLDYNNHTGKNILVCLDADCIVDENYLHEVYQSFHNIDNSGSYIKFRHKIYGDELVHRAMTCYEIYMRYYVLGLKIAESPYAFHTVGSTLACDVESYIKIGGMNKKKGGEDFYFMEKLAKVGEIGYINTTTVYPAGRHSWRVPFGTGPRVKRFGEQTHDEYKLYSFNSFLLLKKWLKIFHADSNLSAKEYLETAGNVDQSIKMFLEQNSFIEEWTKIRKNSKTGEQINKQKVLWFDGLKTLRFIHFLRNNAFPDENMFDVLDNIFQYINVEPPVSRNEGSIPHLEDQLKYLEILRSYA